MELAVAGQSRSQPADDKHSAHCTVAIKVNPQTEDFISSIYSNGWFLVYCTIYLELNALRDLYDNVNLTCRTGAFSDCLLLVW